MKQDGRINMVRFTSLIFEVIAGGTRGVEFVLKVFEVAQSPPGLVLSDIRCNRCKHDCSRSRLSPWQQHHSVDE